MYVELLLGNTYSTLVEEWAGETFVVWFLKSDYNRSCTYIVTIGCVVFLMKIEDVKFTSKKCITCLVPQIR